MNATCAKLNRFFHKLLTENPHFHGKVALNFFDGQVPNLNKSECIKLEDDETAKN